MTKPKKNKEVEQKKDLKSDSKMVTVNMEIDYHLTPEELTENKESLTYIRKPVNCCGRKI